MTVWFKSYILGGRYAVSAAGYNNEWGQLNAHLPKVYTERECYNFGTPTGMACRVEQIYGN